MGCGHVGTPVRVKHSAWGLLASAEHDTCQHAMFTGLSHTVALLGTIL